jgi:hypothetical protein
MVEVVQRLPDGRASEGELEAARSAARAAFVAADAARHATGDAAGSATATAAIAACYADDPATAPLYAAHAAAEEEETRAAERGEIALVTGHFNARGHTPALFKLAGALARAAAPPVFQS